MTDEPKLDKAAQRMTRIALALHDQLLLVEPLEAIGALGVLMSAAVNRFPADERANVAEAWITTFREGLDDDADDGERGRAGG